jgi:hypothetical protein
MINLVFSEILNKMEILQTNQIQKSIQANLMVNIKIKIQKKTSKLLNQ